MTKALNDKALVRAYVEERRPEDFAELATRHGDKVFSLCFRMMGNRQDALDASQEVFLKLLRKIEQYDGRSAFSTWLHRVTANVCYDMLRNRARLPIPAEDPPDLPDMRPLGEMDSGELRPAIEEALSLLPAEFRAAVVLRDMEGFSYAQIEAALGASAGTVRSRIHRGRRLLATHLRNLMDDGDRPTDDAAGEGASLEPEHSGTARGEEDLS